MGARLVDVSDGQVTVRIEGKLSYPELTSLQETVSKIIATNGKIRLLVLAEEFKGWEKGGDWGDLTFQYQFDEQIVKMAVVGEQEWEDLIVVFAAKGFRRFPVEYFLPNEIGKAREWLSQAT